MTFAPGRLHVTHVFGSQVAAIDVQTGEHKVFSPLGAREDTPMWRAPDGYRNELSRGVHQHVDFADASEVVGIGNLDEP